MDSSEEEQKTWKALIGYQVATALWMYEGQITWSAFNAMVLANSIIFASEVSYATGFFQVALKVLGISLCAIWFVITLRGFEIHNYRVLSSREIEETFLSDVVKTVSRGAKFHAGKPVQLTIDNNTKEMKMSPLAKSLSGRTLAIIVILVFTAAHIMSFFSYN